MPAATATSPWYKHLWPWIIIGILACSVTLSLTMVTIAVNNPDNLVNDNYYEAGKGINRSLERELLDRKSVVSGMSVSVSVDLGGLRIFKHTNNERSYTK